MKGAVMPVARACADIGLTARTRRARPGFEVLSLWRDRGHPHGPHHPEYIHDRRGAPPPHQEQLLVCYPTDEVDWAHRYGALLAAGLVAGRNRNPFWERNGRTFVGAAGGRIVLQRCAWHR